MSSPDPSLTTLLQTHPQTYLATNPSLTGGLILSAILHSKTRILLVQRAPTDGFPLAWETPGGGVDPASDASLFAALSREVLEETGLAISLSDVVTLLSSDSSDLDRNDENEGGGVTGVEWDDGHGKRWRKITFLVDLSGDGGDGDGTREEVVVVLNPEEHVDYVWASREDVVEGVSGGREIRFAYGETEGMVLNAFRVVAGG
ncbi:hypothetical protein QBC47DRAFT_338241 [Echria macrotheca]|uniref:Nudix hydrolase domain-containing protein n=1 Tax=Echria macrotheca TaxID=438768 RepID=A0AAJ0BKV8_9PEZI|nr:hypothetical protein QBC47DRAFT_338241 [Echria macrotheca]